MTRAFVFKSVFTALIAFLLIAIAFPDHFFSPATYAYAHGGDGFYISYNFLFHIFYGSGYTLSSMNYPIHELIFMTDAQASFSIVFQHLNTVLNLNSEQLVGLSNFVLLLSQVICIFILTKILCKLKISFLFALAFACAITLMNPQLERMTCGHYGLAYSFLLPLIFLWCICFYKREHSKILTIFSFLSLLFLGFNNIYFTLIAGMFLLCFSMALFIKERELWTKRSITHIVMSVVPPSLILFMVKTMDKVSDRVQNPWGFEIHHSSLKSCFLPQQGPLAALLENHLSIQPGSMEGQAYVGLVTTLVLSIVVFGILLKSSKPWKNNQLNSAWFLLLCSIIPLLFSFSFPFVGPFKPFADYIPFIQQFRAPGRFSWPFYFAATIFATTYLFHSVGNQKIRTLLLSLAVLVWIAEVKWNIDSRRTHIYNENPFSNAEMDKFVNIADSLKITKDKYQAIYFLPVDESWSEKLIYPSYFASYFHGYRMSLATGIPTINANLSRMSVSQAAMAVQIASDPIIPKSLFAHLPNKLPILLFYGNDEIPLRASEKYLIQESDTLYSGEKFSIFEYRPTDSWNEYRDEIFRKIDTSRQELHTLLYDHFDNNPKTEFSFYSKNCKEVPKGTHQHAQISISSNMQKDTFVWSAWVHMDTRRHGMPTWDFIQIDDRDQILQQDRFWSSNTIDVQGDWAKAQGEFIIKEKVSQLQVKTNYHGSSHIDELLVCNKGQNVIYLDPSDKDYMLLNNFKILRPHSSLDKIH